MSADALRSLIARVEAATGPDRDIDGAISALFLPSVESDDGDWGWGPHDQLPQRVPRYTDSLAAAVSLVPSGWQWLVGSNESQPLGTAYAMLGSSAAFGKAATPALALCAAALRARAAMVEDQR